MDVTSLARTYVGGGRRPLVAERHRPAILGTACLLLFLASKLHLPSDSKYALVAAHTLVRYGTPALDRWFGDAADGGAGWPRSYHVIDEGDHVFYIFPYGGSFLAAPVVGLVELFGGPRVVMPDGQYNERAEQKLQKLMAAILMAVAVALWYRTARLVLPDPQAAILTAGTALGTSVWSTAALTLWSQTWAVFLLCCSLAIVIRSELREASPRAVLLGSLLSWCFLVRPTMALSAVAIAVFVGFRRPRQFVPLALTGGLWFAAFLAWCRITYGAWLPWYFRAGRLTFEHFQEALAGNLISPGRGLFVYIPVAAYVTYTALRYARRSRLWPLVCPAAACIVLHLIAVSGFGHWWGGHSFGPRLQLEMIPWWFVLALVGEDGRRNAELPRPRRRLEWATAVVLLTVSVGIHALGANSWDAAAWNAVPASVDVHPERLWNWSDVPFLRPMSLNRHSS